MNKYFSVYMFQETKVHVGLQIIFVYLFIGHDTLSFLFTVYVISFVRSTSSHIRNTKVDEVQIFVRFVMIYDTYVHFIVTFLNVYIHLLYVF